MYWGESASARRSTCTASPTRRTPLDLQKGFAHPGTEVKELFRSAEPASRCRRRSPTRCRSAGAVHARVGSRRATPRAAPISARSTSSSTARIASFLSPGLGFASAARLPSRTQRGECGLSARWSPGVARRHDGPRTTASSPTSSPQVLDADAGAAWRPASVQHDLRRQHRAGRRQPGQEHRRRQHSAPSSRTATTRRCSARCWAWPLACPARATPGRAATPSTAVVNALGTDAEDAGVRPGGLAAEVTYAHLTNVTSGANLFNAVGYAPCWPTAPAAPATSTSGTAASPGTTSAPASPSRRPGSRSFPGVDLSAPLTYAVGLSGNSPTAFGGNQGLGNYSARRPADVLQKYRFDLKYIDFVGHTRDNGTAVTSQNGLTAFLKRSRLPSA